VRGLLGSEKGKFMQDILTNLEKLGYSWAYRVINSMCTGCQNCNVFPSVVGVPHFRKRVFILASLAADPRDVLLTDSFPEPGKSMSQQLPYF
jgi:DNA (cytosine-5)-methyltransferase 1